MASAARRRWARAARSSSAFCSARPTCTGRDSTNEGTTGLCVIQKRTRPGRVLPRAPHLRRTQDQTPDATVQLRTRHQIRQYKRGHDTGRVWCKGGHERRVWSLLLAEAPLKRTRHRLRLYKCGRDTESHSTNEDTTRLVCGSHERMSDRGRRAPRAPQVVRPLGRTQVVRPLDRTQVVRPLDRTHVVRPREQAPGKRAPRVGPTSIVIPHVNEVSQIGSSAMAPMAVTEVGELCEQVVRPRCRTQVVSTNELATEVDERMRVSKEPESPEPKCSEPKSPDARGRHTQVVRPHCRTQVGGLRAQVAASTPRAHASGVTVHGVGQRGLECTRKDNG